MMLGEVEEEEEVVEVVEEEEEEEKGPNRKENSRKGQCPVRN